MARSSIEYVILVVALFGVLLSIYAVSLHYAPSSSKYCTFGAALNCDKVNKSPWSAIMGVPVALLGLVAYLAVFLVTLKRRAIQRTLAFTAKDFFFYLLIVALVMLSFQAYLTFVEAFLIQAYCVVCLASQGCTLVLAIAVGKEWSHAR